MADDDETTGEDVRVDEVMGIDHSEQSGLGGDSSVLEEYGEDTDPTDAMAEKPEVPLEQPLPGTDPDVPADLALAEGGPDPTLPQPGHELKPGIAQAADAPLKRPKDAKDAMDTSGNVE
jgi:hypothetical protein